MTDDVVPSRLYFQTGCESIGEGLELQLEKFLRQHPDTALIVIDTLQKVRAADPSSGAYASDYQDMSALKSLADRHRIGMLLVHHLRKQGAADPFHQISGSNGLMGAADTIWLLQRQRMSTAARLLVTGRDMDSRTLHVQAEDCVWQLIDEETAGRAGRTGSSCMAVEDCGFSAGCRILGRDRERSRWLLRDFPSRSPICSRAGLWSITTRCSLRVGSIMRAVAQPEPGG